MANISEYTFQDLINGSEADLTYESFSANMDRILAIADKKSREEQMREYYQSLALTTARSGIIRRGLASLCKAFRDEYHGKIYASSIGSEEAIVQLMNEYCREKNSDFECKPRMGASYEEYVDFIRSAAFSVTMADVQDEFFKRANGPILKEAIDTVVGRFEKDSTYTYMPGMTRKEDRNVAEAYSIYNHIKNERKLGFFDFIAHPINSIRDYFANRSAIKSAEKLFKNVGFNIEEHGEEAVSKTAMIPDSATEREDADCKDILDQVKAIRANENKKEAQAQKKVTKPPVVAADKFKDACKKEALGGEDTAFAQIGKIYEKYGIALAKNEMGLPDKAIYSMDTLLSANESYDKYKVLGTTEEFMQRTFYENISKMVKAACEKEKATGEKMNISEIVKDASLASNIVYEKFTVVHEADEAYALEETCTFAGFTADRTLNAVNRQLGAEGMADKYDLNEIKAEIENTMAEYKTPYMQEKEAAETSAQKKEDIIENNAESTEKEENVAENSSRYSISIDLSTGEATEQVQPMIKEEPLTKSSPTLNQ